MGSTLGGVVAGIEAGSTNIVAASGGKTSKVTVTVDHGAVSTVSISAPQGSTIVEGATTQGGTPKPLIATVMDAKGHALNDSPSNLTWSSADANVAKVSSLGEVTGVVAGSTSINVTAGSASGTATVTIVHGSPNSVTIAGSSTIVEGGSGGYSAKVLDVMAHELPGQSMVWASSNANWAVVSNPSSGNVSAVSAGSVTISATTSNNKVGTKAVTINHGAVNTLTLPKVINVKWSLANGKTTLKATLKDAKGHVVSGKITWKVTGQANIWLTGATGNQVTVNGGFLIGASQVTATSNGKSAKVTVFVQL